MVDHWANTIRPRNKLSTGLDTEVARRFAKQHRCFPRQVFLLCFSSGSCFRSFTLSNSLLECALACRLINWGVILHTMKIIIKVGDVLREAADVLISTANPWLNLSGGVNGAILQTVGPDLQTELHELLKQQGISALPAGAVVRSNAYSLPFKHILHAVAIDPFYDSTKDTVAWSGVSVS